MTHVFDMIGALDRLTLRSEFWKYGNTQIGQRRPTTVLHMTNTETSIFLQTHSKADYPRLPTPSHIWTNVSIDVRCRLLRGLHDVARVHERVCSIDLLPGQTSQSDFVTCAQYVRIIFGSIIYGVRFY